MSNAIYPSLLGLTMDVTKTPEFSTQVQRSVNLSELRASFADAPVYRFKLAYDMLRDNVANAELKSLQGFFLARYGAWDSFLFTDPTDASISGQSFGTGDGLTTVFQLTRSYGGATEDVANVNAITSITLANTPTSNYTQNAGVITFTSAPAANVAIAWTGSYYYRCRFVNDTQDFTQFMYQLWEAGTVEFIGSIGSRI